MNFEKIHNKGQARLFKNQNLEYLTKTHPLVIWGMYIPVMAGIIFYNKTVLGFSSLYIFIFFIAGIFVWSLFEYLIHRFLFHFMAKSERMMRMLYVLHGNHHEYPRDRERLFMPPVPSLIISLLFFMIMYLPAELFHFGKYVFAFFPGFILGYLLYGTMHYAIHAWNPPFKWMKALWRNHHLHHYKDMELGFGVSSTLWDHVFGTMFDLKKEKEDKEKTRELMFNTTRITKKTELVAEE